MLDRLIHDLKFGLKMLFKHRGFTATALLTLALCIGGNSAIFSVVHSILLRPLPFEEPDRIVSMFNAYPGVGVDRGSNSKPDWVQRREATDIFEEVAMYADGSYFSGEAGSPIKIDALQVNPSYFAVLRIQPILGRPFAEADGTKESERVAILSHKLWETMFASDPNVVGKTISLSNHSHTIVGVLEKEQHLVGGSLSGTDLILPFRWGPKDLSLDNLHNNNHPMVARLAPGATLAQAQGKVDAINAANTEASPYKALLEEANYHTQVHFTHELMVQDIRRSIVLLQFGVLFVLLIGCVNVANLMLVRSNVRLKEMAIRLSLGASRIRLSSQLFTESLLISILGGAAGLLLGWVSLQALNTFGVEDLPRGETVSMDLEVLGFTLAVSVLAGFLSGFLPVLNIWRTNLNQIMHEESRSTSSGKSTLFVRNAFIVSQVALAFVLLIASGFLALSFKKILEVDPGFSSDKVLVVRLNLPYQLYGEAKDRNQFNDRILEELRALPGVQYASVTTSTPFGGVDNSSALEIEGAERNSDNLVPVPNRNAVGIDYFDALRIPLLDGRLFDATDTWDTNRVAIVDEEFIQRNLPGRNPIGMRMTNDLGEDDPEYWTIVGVVGSIHHHSLTETRGEGFAYYPYAQLPWNQPDYIIRAQGDPEALRDSVRQAFLNVDDRLPITYMLTLNSIVDNSLVGRRTPLLLISVFSGLAIILALIGIYSVLAYVVSQRTKEIGIRMAIGANPIRILLLFLNRGAILLLLGLGLGLAASLFLNRFLQDLLFEVNISQPGIYLTSALAMGIIGLLACLIPSWRATRVHPMEALRHE